MFRLISCRGEDLKDDTRSLICVRSIWAGHVRAFYISLVATRELPVQRASKKGLLRTGLAAAKNVAFRVRLLCLAWGWEFCNCGVKLGTWRKQDNSTSRRHSDVWRRYLFVFAFLVSFEEVFCPWAQTPTITAR